MKIKKNVAKIQQSLMSKILIILLAFSLSLSLSACSTKDKNEKDEIVLEKKPINPNPQEKAREFANKGGGILGDFNKRGGGTTYNFATSNVLWRASLNSLKSIPLQAIDYGGGIITTDWYSANDSDSRESIKITVRFLSDKVSANSIEIISHKKQCDQTYSKCNISTLKDTFNEQIKNKIMKEVIALNIEEKKQEKSK